MGAVVISILTAEPLYAGARWLGARLDAPARGSREKRCARPAPPRRDPRIRARWPRGCAGPRVARVRIRGGRQRLRGRPRGPVSGMRVVFGEAGRPPVLDRCRDRRLHAVIVAIPDALATRQAVAYARARNPRVEIVARAHSEAEEAELRRLGVRASWWRSARSATSSSATPFGASASATARRPRSWSHVGAEVWRRARGIRRVGPSNPARRALVRTAEVASVSGATTVGTAPSGDHAPRPATDPDGAHPGGGRRQHVVVDPVPDIGDLARRR